MAIGARSTITILCLLPLFQTTAACADTFTRGHFYSPTYEGTIAEFDEGLNFIREISIDADITNAAGAVFNDKGHLVFIGHTGNRNIIYEVDAEGTVISEFDTGPSPLFAASFIDFDPGSRRYAFANDSNITVLDHDLDLVGTTPSIFDRASGVKFGAGGTLYATDLDENTLRQFDEDLNLVNEFGIGGYDNTGLELLNDGPVLYASHRRDRIDAYNLETGELTVGVLTNIDQPADVFELPDGRLGVVSSNGPFYLYSSDWELLHTANTPDSFRDGVAYFVPAPAIAPQLLVGLAFTCRRRRRTPSSRRDETLRTDSA